MDKLARCVWKSDVFAAVRIVCFDLLVGKLVHISSVCEGGVRGTGRCIEVHGGIIAWSCAHGITVDIVHNTSPVGEFLFDRLVAVGHDHTAIGHLNFPSARVSWRLRLLLLLLLLGYWL